MKENVKFKERTILNEGYFPLERIVYSHKKIDGDWSQNREQEIVHRGDVVTVIPYDPVLNKIVLIKQFRLGAYLDTVRLEKDQFTGEIMELVSGSVDQGETIEQAARRELAEETNLTCNELFPLGSILVSPSFSDERMHFMCAKIDSSHFHPQLCGIESDGESILPIIKDCSEVFRMLHSDKLARASTIIALYRLNYFLNCPIPAVERASV